MIPKKHKNIISWKRILLRKCIFHCKIFRVSFYSPTKSSFNLVPQYPNQVFLLHICSLLTLEDRTELVTELALFPCVLWELNYQQLTTLRDFYSCESGMTFSETDWSLHRGREVAFQLWTKFFHIDLLWHITSMWLCLWEVFSCNFQANMIYPPVVNLLQRLIIFCLC